MADTKIERWDKVWNPKRLEQPLKWKKPQKIFVNSMSDLFHEDVFSVTCADDKIYTLYVCEKCMEKCQIKEADAENE
jgi:protein gp37